MKKTKKIISLLLSVLMIITALPLTAVNSFAETPTSGTTGDCTWSLDGTVLTVTGNGKMGDYTANQVSPWGNSITEVIIENGVTNIGEGAFDVCYSLESVTIPDSVTSIGNSAFSSCSSLKSLVIPDSVTEIGNYAFFDCPFTSFTVPDSVTSIGEFAFKSCTSLKSIAVSDSVTVIGQHAFDNCTALTSFTVPDSVTSIADSTFCDCESLTDVVIGNGVKNIDMKAFAYCTALTDINIPDNVISIGSSAFWVCTSLKNVTVGKGVKSMGGLVFPECRSLENINVSDDNMNYSSADGVLFNKDKTVLIQYPVGRTDTSYAVPDGVTTIGNSSFKGGKSLENITIPKSVTSIGNSAFDNTAYFNNDANWNGRVLYIDDCLIKGKNANKNASINVKEGTRLIADYAFYECDLYKSITLPDSIAIIGSFAFCDCTALSDITVPDSVVSIGGSAFNSCTSLASIAIPENVISIGDYAFCNCTSLTQVNVAENNKNYCSVNGVLFNKDMTRLIQYPASKTDTEYTVPDSVTEIVGRAFCKCGILENITIPDTVTEIGEYAFYNCTSLKSIAVPHGITSIAEYAFYKCTSLRSADIPDSITEIGEYAFAYCIALESITILNSVTTINEGAFYYCTELFEVFVPDSVTYIGPWALQAIIKTYCNSYASTCFKESRLRIIHDFSDAFTVDEEPTCIKTGLKSRHCTRCDEITDITEMPVSDHAYGEWIITEEPTCTTEGTREKVCAVCEDKITETVSALDHDFSDEFTVDEEPTCIKTGLKSRHCTRCDEITDITEMPVSDHHTYGEWEITTEPTYSSEGVSTRKCSVCDKTETQSVPKKTLPFPDVVNDDWYYNAVAFNVDRGYFHGYENGYFGPGNNIQRQDFVVVLSKIAGADLSAYAGQNGGFSDVPTNDYYSAAVAWAKDNHILSGYANGKFGVGDPITREQACVIFFNYITGYCDMGVGSSNTPEEICSRYPDGNAVSDWARTAVAWAAENHIVGGNGKLNPAGNANRAEMAQIIMNMSNNNIL